MKNNVEKRYKYEVQVLSTDKKVVGFHFQKDFVSTDQAESFRKTEEVERGHPVRLNFLYEFEATNYYKEPEFVKSEKVEDTNVNVDYLNGEDQKDDETDDTVVKTPSKRGRKPKIIKAG